MLELLLWSNGLSKLGSSEMYRQRGILFMVNELTFNSFKQLKVILLLLVLVGFKLELI